MTPPFRSESTATVPLVDRALAPLRRFLNTQAAASVLLLGATAVALAWANSPWHESYFHLWENELEVTLAGRSFATTLHGVVNDALMAIFFFVVGLEIKREILAGELASAQRAALPAIGALGGMIVPAVLFATLNGRGDGAAGWGIPMATDIAFALGVLALLGDRVPTGLKVFLAALAIIDDIGAILVIAIFYSEGIRWGLVLVAGAILLMSLIANAIGIRRVQVYAAIGLALWAVVLASGIHATVAGVALALTIPVRTRLDESSFLSSARRALADFEAAGQAPRSAYSALANQRRHGAMEEMESLIEGVQPPLIRLERGLHGFVAFGIMPLFALSNAGVTLSAGEIDWTTGAPVAVGVILGLVLGKVTGITLFCWLGVRARIATLPNGVSWRILAGAGVLGGIGFTMSLFIANLAFPGSDMLGAAKVGVFTASMLAGVAGSLILRAALSSAGR